MKRKPSSGLFLLTLTFLVLLSAVGTTLLSPALAMATVVRIEPAASSVEAGQTVAVSVVIEGVSDLFGAEFHLQFNPAYLEVVDADPGKDGVQIQDGDFLNPEITAQNQVDNNAGTVDYAISQMSPTEPVNGSGTVATITFIAKAAGTSDVTFTDVLLSDSTGRLITESVQNGAVTITGSAEPSPTPTEPPATEAPTDTPPPASPTTTAEPGDPTPTTAPATPTATPEPTVTPATPTPTPETTPRPTPTTAPDTCTIQGYHVVQRGETIYAIGRAYATRPVRIIACNRLLNPSRIHTGLSLAIPIAPWMPAPAGPTARRQFQPQCAPCLPAPPCRYYHTVQPRETLTAIAWRYHATIWAIARANTIYNLNLIYPGQVLCIP